MYSLTGRGHEDVLEYAVAQGIAFIPWFPLSAGAHAATEGPLAEVAAELGASPAQVSLAWLLHRSPVLLPIPRTTSVAHLAENVAAQGLKLSDGQMRKLSGPA